MILLVWTCGALLKAALLPVEELLEQSAQGQYAGEHQDPGPVMQFGRLKQSGCKLDDQTGDCTVSDSRRASAVSRLRIRTTTAAVAYPTM